MVYSLTFINLGTLELIMSAKNIIIGLSVSCFIGVLSGIIPAAMASRLDPVEAIRA
jgi:putative ABC transport system permease protein